MSPDTLWDLVRRCFEVDDGSRPTVAISQLTAEEVADVYALIRREAPLSSHDATFWDTRTRRERKLDDVENAGALVSSNTAGPFHFSVGLPGEWAADAPWLGVHVFQRSIAFDYQMGREWNGDRVFALFTWLKHLLDRVPAAALVPDRDEGPPYPDEFLAAWHLFRGDGAR
jgi:hypothetical protein